ncbi:MAG: filamentous hemagglutinin, partial [Cyanobacteria bacterium P01_D01_bin.116]
DLVDLLETEQPNELDASELLTNDITAISQENPDLSGVVTINALEIDPTRGLIELASVPIDTEVAPACGESTTGNQSEFYITGKGGIAPSPLDLLQEESVDVGWVKLPEEIESRGSRGSRGSRVLRQNPKSQLQNPKSKIQNRIVEATGWIVDGNGDIFFVAEAPSTSNSQFNNASCLKN